MHRLELRKPGFYPPKGKKYSYQGPTGDCCSGNFCGVELSLTCDSAGGKEDAYSVNLKARRAESTGIFPLPSSASTQWKPILIGSDAQPHYWRFDLQTVTVFWISSSLRKEPWTRLLNFYNKLIPVLDWEASYVQRVDNSMNILKFIGLYILNNWILWDMNYVSGKLLQNNNDKEKPHVTMYQVKKSNTYCICFQICCLFMSTNTGFAFTVVV